MITLLIRDGSQITMDLADSLEQSTELASALVPQTQQANLLSLRLTDGSTFMISSSEIVGLHLPSEPASRVRAPTPAKSATSQPGVASKSASRLASSLPDTELYQVGSRRVLHVKNFLPAPVTQSLYEHALASEEAFQGSTVISKDPEYRKSVVLFQFPHYEAMFRAALRSALPAICQSIEIQEFRLADIDCQLTATLNKGYFKPHTDNAAALGHRRITYVYYFHRVPRPYRGGEIRFFDHDPFAAEQPDAKNTLDLLPLNNSIVFFESGCFHEVREVGCNPPDFANARFTVNGWMNEAR